MVSIVEELGRLLPGKGETGSDFICGFSLVDNEANGIGDGATSPEILERK